jgi:hypothetical protein
MSPSDSPADWSGSTSSSSSSSSSASAPWSGSPSEREADKFKASPDAMRMRAGTGADGAERTEVFEQRAALQRTSMGAFFEEISGYFGGAETMYAHLCDDVPQLAQRRPCPTQARP